MDEPREKKLRIAPFALHAARGMIRDQNARRKIMFVAVLVAVAAPDSEAKREGYDCVYMACSAACGTALQAAFQTEIERGNRKNRHSNPSI